MSLWRMSSIWSNTRSLVVFIVTHQMEDGINSVGMLNAYASAMQRFNSRKTNCRKMLNKSQNERNKERKRGKKIIATYVIYAPHPSPVVNGLSFTPLSLIPPGNHFHLYGCDHWSMWDIWHMHTCLELLSFPLFKCLFFTLCMSFSVTSHSTAVFRQCCTA